MGVMMMQKTRSGVAVMLLMTLVVVMLAMMVSSAQGKTDDAAAGGGGEADSDVIALTDLTFDGAIASSKMYFVKVRADEDAIHDLRMRMCVMSD